MLNTLWPVWLPAGLRSWAWGAAGWVQRLLATPGKDGWGQTQAMLSWGPKFPTVLLPPSSQPAQLHVRVSKPSNSPDDPVYLNALNYQVFLTLDHFH